MKSIIALVMLAFATVSFATEPAKKEEAKTAAKKAEAKPAAKKAEAKAEPAKK
jgi:hypothetical protein